MISFKDDYGQSRGFAKYFHKFVMFVLFPFRKPWAFIILLALLYVAPVVLERIEPLKVHLWYKDKIVSLYEEAKTKVADKTKELVPSVGGGVESTGVATSDKIVDLPRRRSAARRKTFEKAKATPNTIDIMETQKNLVVASGIPAEVDEDVVVADPKTVAQNKVEQKLNLNYLEQPKELSGSVKVKNANEVYVNDTLVVLYGIYADPYSVKGLQAEDYLNKLLSGKVVRCTINAYTYQNVATGLCYIGNTSLNRLLVDEGFSKNVAL